MLSPVSMVRLDAVLLERDEHAVLKEFGSLEAIEFTPGRPGPDSAPLPPRDFAREIGMCLHVRSRVEDLRRSLALAPLTGDHMLAEVTLQEAEEKLKDMEEQVASVLALRQTLLHRDKELAAICDRASCYQGFHIPVDELEGMRFLHFVAGSMPIQNFEAFEKEADARTVIFPMTRREGRQTLVAVTTGEGEPGLEKALQQGGFQREALPGPRNGNGKGTTVKMISEEGEQERQLIAAELAQADDRLKALGESFAQSLNQIERLADVECRLLEETQKFPRTEDAVLLTGWVPAHEVENLTERMHAVTGGKCAVTTAPPGNVKEEDIPVLLKHSRILRPFEMLVATYGLPSYRELEPTLFVAISYIFMFGMMFGDAGHGAVLALFGLALLLRSSSDQGKDFGLLLLLGGSSSFIFGVIYGSFFGIEWFKHYALWHDPLEGDPIQLMYGAIGFGIVMMTLGLILNMVNRFRRGDVLGGFLDKFGLTGLLFYWGAIFILLQGAAIQSRGLMPLAITIFLIFPIISWAAKEIIDHLRASHTETEHEGSGGIVGAAMESAVGSFEAVLTYLANTISFVRLAAYAMSHAALLVAAFVLAREVRDFPIGGSFWSVLVVILGNMIALVLEGIIASVQALRLEYYEFFGKFFSGTGQPFKPFRLTPGGRPPT